MCLSHEITGPSDAPVLVLSGSIGTTMSMWDDQVSELEEAFRIVRYDHPGHGRSADPSARASVAELARALYALLEQESIERWSMCGISMGGMVAMHLAAHHPDRVDRLVLCSTALGIPSPDPWNQRAATVRQQGLDTIADTVMERYFSESFRKAHPETVARYRAELLSCSAEGYARCCEALGRWRFEDAQQIVCPTLVLTGSADAALPTSLTGGVALAIHNARHSQLDDAGHLVTVERPAETTAAILRHLTGSR